jgi:hypothetical protein
MKKLLSISILLMIIVSCTSYSTTRRAEPENIINAPIDVVWERTLEILPTERMTIKNIDKENYFIEAKKHVTFLSPGDNVNIRLIQKGEKQTIMHCSAETVWHYWVDFGHECRMAINIFNRIKNASESSSF